MKLTIFGATGRVGGHLLELAQRDGHDVRVVVRDAARLPAHGPGVEVVIADLSSPDPLVPALVGREAVLSAIGARNRAAARDQVATRATRVILAAMARADVERIVAVSAAPVGPPAPDEGLFTRAVVLPLLGRALRPVYDDLAAMEAELAASGADWTAFRPPKLGDRPARGGYRTAPGHAVAGGPTVTRGDLAAAMLAEAVDPAHQAHVIGIAN